MKAIILLLLPISFVLLLSSCGEDESDVSEDIMEPNDQIANAFQIVPGQAYEAYISPIADIDYFKIAAPIEPESGNLLKISLAPFSLYPEMTIYNQDKVEICNYYETTEGAELYTWMAAKPGVVYFIQVNVWRSEWRAETAISPYNLVVSYDYVADTSEPDNNFDQATPIDMGDTYAAHFFAGEPTDVKNYEDYYIVTTTEAGKIKAELENVPANVYPELSILNSERSVIAIGSEATKGANLTVTTRDFGPDDYYIIVTPKTNFPMPDWYGKGKELPEHLMSDYFLTVTLE